MAARALVLSLGGLCAAAACSLSQQGVSPPADTFFYPSAAVMDPTGQWLFVANSNADLRYNDGTLVTVNLALAEQDRTSTGGNVPPSSSNHQTWELCPQEDYVNPLSRSDPPICCWDQLDASILNCDERRYIQPDSTVRIGSFAAGMYWQSYCPDSCAGACTPDGTTGRILMGVRGDTSLTWLDISAGTQASSVNPGFTPPQVFCGPTPGVSLSECDDTHRIIDTTTALTTESGDTQAPAVAVPDEPYALEIDPDRDLLYVGHLTGSTATVDSGGVSLFDVSSSDPLTFKQHGFIAPFASPFSPNSAGAFGITALMRHPPLGQPAGSGNVIFASSRYIPQIASVNAFGASICGSDDTDIVVEPAGDGLSSGLVGSEMRGVAFIDPLTADPSSYAQRAYALERVPPDLVGFDIARNNAGTMAAIPTDFSETCSSPTFLYKHMVTTEEGPRLFVNCFDTGEVYVFDPTVPTLLTTFQVGRGPAGMEFFPPDNATPSSIPPARATAQTVAYVIGFSDNNLSVVDLAPGSQTQYHVIQRIGFPSVMPR
jgi:hypothetical protein